MTVTVSPITSFAANASMSANRATAPLLSSARATAPNAPKKGITPHFLAPHQTSRHSFYAALKGSDE